MQLAFGKMFARAKITRAHLIQTTCYLVLIGIFVYLLFLSRTPVPSTVWNTFDPSNLAVYLAATILLMIIIMARTASGLKLSLIVVHSVVSHMFFVIVFESRYGWDQWLGAGVTIRMFNGEFLSPIYGSGSLVSKVYSSMVRKTLPSLSVGLANMTSIDVYWVHLLLVPVLWGVFIPILCYSLSMIVSKNRSVSLLSALLSIGVPPLVGWGAVTTTGSLAWISFLFLVILLLKYVDTGVHLKLITIILLSLFMIHELFAAVALPLVLLAYIYRKYDIGSHSISATTLFMVFLALIFVLPLSFKVRQLMTGSAVGPYFSLTPFEKLPIYDAINVLIFGGYAELEFKDALVQGIVPLLGMVGLLYISLEKEGSFNRKLSLLLFLSFILFEVDYRILRLFMMAVPLSPKRLWIFQDLLVIPFAVFVIYKSMRYFQNRISSRESSLGISGKIRDIEKKSKGFLSTGFRGALVNGLLVLALSGLVTASVYNGYPHYSEAIWTTAYELDAAKFIEATTNETYMVMCPPLTRCAGWVVVGPENPRAFYYGAWTRNEIIQRELYKKMIENPSLEFVFEAMQVNNATVAYFIVSKLRQAKAEQVIQSLVGFPYFELYGVFGEDVYVYKVKPPLSRIVKGVGPSVYVYSLEQRLNTTKTLDIFTYETTYKLPLNGSQSYNLTDWPLFWSFESVVPDPVLMDVDANNWINFTGSENIVYNVTWAGNTLYQQVGWKDDSFKAGWDVRHLGSGHWLPDQQPIESTDGDVFNLTGFFQENVREYHWLEKKMENISTDDYPYLLLRWRSTSTNAIAAVYYTEGKGDLILRYGSHSLNWTLTITKLPEGKKIASLMVGLDDLTDTSGWQQAQYDFIMLAKLT